MARRPRECGVVACGLAACGLLVAQFATGAAIAAPSSAILPWQYSGWLGKSGMFVQSTPQSLLVLRVARHSPAALAGVEGPAPKPARPAKGKPAEGEVLRILSINGRSPADLTARELKDTFAPVPAAGRVAVMFGRRGPGDLQEAREGPVLVDIFPPASGRAYQLAGERQWQRALEAAKGNQEIRSGVVARMLFDAQQQALSGNPSTALKVLALVPRDDPGHQRALELSHRYERVTREARRPADSR